MSRSRTDRGATLVFAFLAVLLIVVGTWKVLTPESGSGTRDMLGNPVALEPGTGPTDDQLKQMDAVEDDGQRLRVPSVDLDVPLGALDMVDDTINPPGFTSAYQVRNLGVPLEDASTGTVYVVMHSLRAGVGPGNHLIDVEAQASRVEPGAKIIIGDRTWTATGDLTVTKPELGAQEHLFDDTPGRLVLITCQQRSDGKAAGENLVITAQLTH